MNELSSVPSILRDAWNFQSVMPDGRVRIHQQKDPEKSGGYYASQAYVEQVLREVPLVNAQKAIPIGRELSAILTGNPGSFTPRPEKTWKRIRQKGTSKYTHEGSAHYPFIVDFAGGKIEEDNDEVAQLTLNTIGEPGLYRLPSGHTFRMLRVANNMAHSNEGVAGLCNIRFNIAVDFEDANMDAGEGMCSKGHVIEFQVTPKSKELLESSHEAYCWQRRYLGLIEKIEKAGKRLRDPDSAHAVARMLLRDRLRELEIETKHRRIEFNRLVVDQTPWLAKMRNYQINTEKRHPAVEKLPEHGISSSVRFVAA